VTPRTTHHAGCSCRRHQPSRRGWAVVRDCQVSAPQHQRDAQGAGSRPRCVFAAWPRSGQLTSVVTARGSACCAHAELCRVPCCHTVCACVALTSRLGSCRRAADAHDAHCHGRVDGRVVDSAHIQRDRRQHIPREFLQGGKTAAGCLSAAACARRLSGVIARA
jgi:hypothetical protein